MPRYANLSGNSGVRQYDTRAEAIIVTFRDGGKYLYNYERPGQAAVEHMKTLAAAGLGLSTYISTTVRTNYARKLR